MQISIEKNGKLYVGSYSVSKGMLTVFTLDYGQKSAQLGLLPPEVLARTLLRELCGDKVD
jgi:hypothetical protein